MVVMLDGKIYSDTGYFSDAPLNNTDFKYAPRYILDLTKMYMDNKTQEAVGKAIVKNFDGKDFKDLIKTMLKPGSGYTKSDKTRYEYELAIKDLEKIWIDMDSKKIPKDFIFYDIKDNSTISLDISSNNTRVDIKVYSPIGSDRILNTKATSFTGYGLEIKGQGTIK